MGATLTTDRLVLRPYAASDAPDIALLCGDRAIAETTLTIPHPYRIEDAEAWIAKTATDSAAGRCAEFAVTLRADGSLIGGIGLRLDRDHDRAELGYWIGKDSWGRGYATEAARAVVRHGFTALAINRIAAHHFTNNPASGRVLQKVGMRYEGRLRQAFKKWGEYRDADAYAILRADLDTPERTTT